MRTRDGQEHTLQAARFRADAARAYLEARRGESWTSIAQFPLEDVECVQRRLNEPDGRWTWITELGER